MSVCHTIYYFSLKIRVKNEEDPSEALRRCLFLLASILSGFAKRLFAAFRAAIFPLLLSDDIDDHAAVVHAGNRIDAVRQVEITGRVLCEARSLQSVVGAPLRGLRTVATHSYYHINREYTEKVTFGNSFGHCRAFIPGFVGLR